MFTRRDILKILGTVMGMVSFGKMTMDVDGLLGVGCCLLEGEIQRRG